MRAGPRWRRAAPSPAAGLLGLALGFTLLSPGRAAALSCAAQDSVCQQLQQAQQQQQDSAGRLAQIAGSIADTQQKANQTLALIRGLDAQIAAQKTAIAQTQTRVADTERQIRFTEADLARQDAQLQLRRQLLDQRVRALDKQGPLDYLELIVTSTSFTELIDRLEVVQDVVRGDQRLMDSLRQARAQIAQAQRRLQAERAQEAALLVQQQAQQRRLEASLAAQQAALDYLQQLEAQEQAQQQELQADKARLDALVAQLQAQYDAEAGRLGGGTGRFAWPELGPITQPFGCSDLLIEVYDPSCPTPHRFHTGLDIGAGYGTTVAVADTGIVAFTGWLGCYGNAIVVSHGNGYSTLYAHLSAIGVRVGQDVGRGQPIGQEGSTGCSTGPHLHFEIRFNGAPQNPLAYLP